MNRIETIASFSKESFWLKVKSIFAFATIFTVTMSQMPLISVMAMKNNEYSEKNEINKYEDLSSYFDGFDGSFVLYDLNNDAYSVYNENKSFKRVSPNSTYKIYSALFALESGAITEENSNLAWDGIEYTFKEWNQNQNLNTAMKNSVNWYFDKLNQEVGYISIKAYFNKINYGNCDFSGGESDFWAESSLKISPFEQVELLKNIYLNTYEFNEVNVDAIKSALRLSEKDSAVLYGKTGSGSVNGKGINGWFTGYVEKSGNVYFFAVNIEGEDNANGSEASKIALDILNDKGLY